MPSTVKHVRTAYTIGNITHALTEWDRIQSARDKHHNRFFLGIAFGSVEEVKADALEAGETLTPEEIARRALTGRCLDFVLKLIA
jgi:hypothetical protein